jgi:hypothetical protein
MIPSLNLKQERRYYMWERTDLRLDLIGLKVGKLEIIEYHGKSKSGHTLWLAKCDCDNTKIVLGKDFKRGKGGNKCKQCHLVEKSERARIHGDYNTKFYRTWVYLKRRCNHKESYEHVSYDPRWEDFLEFKKDMYLEFLYIVKQLGYDQDSLSIERVNVYKGYNKDNCTFIPMNKQNINKRTTHRFRAISPEGYSFIVRNAEQFAKKYNLNPSHVRDCIRGEIKSHKGWTFENLKLYKNK